MEDFQFEVFTVSKAVCLSYQPSDFVVESLHLNLADGAVPMQQWDCSHDPDILDLLKRMPRRYAGELKLLLEVLITAPPQTVVDLRRQLTG